MNKAELVEIVQNNLGEDATKAAAERALDAVIDAIQTGIIESESVQLIGFGTFSKSERAARTGVNPQTGAKIQIAASKTVKLKPGAKLKAAL